jgi:hypothetical protein
VKHSLDFLLSSCIQSAFPDRSPFLDCQKLHAITRLTQLKKYKENDFECKGETSSLFVDTKYKSYTFDASFGSF